MKRPKSFDIKAKFTNFGEKGVNMEGPGKIFIKGDTKILKSGDLLQLHKVDSKGSGTRISGGARPQLEGAFDAFPFI